MSPAQTQAFNTLFGQPSQALVDMLGALHREVVELRAIVEKRGEDDRWLDSTEAAAYLGMTENTWDKYRSTACTNRIPGHRVGGKTLFKKSELDRWVKLWEAREQGRV